MAAGFQADHGLDRHAGHVNELSDALREVAGAARRTGLPADAYGRFCQGFAFTVRQLEQTAVPVLERAAVVTDAAAAALRATAGAYREVDREFVERAGAPE